VRGHFIGKKNNMNPTDHIQKLIICTPLATYKSLQGFIVQHQSGDFYEGK